MVGETKPPDPLAALAAAAPRWTPDAGASTNGHGAADAEPPARRAAQGPPAAVDRAALYGLPGEVVRAIEPYSEGDPMGLLINFLIAAGSVIGPGPHARAEADKHGVNLFAVQVGETSKGRKGTAWGRIRELLATVDPEWADTRIMGGLSSGEGLIWHVRDRIVKSKPDKAKAGQIHTEIVDDGVDDKRLQVVEGEFAGPLKIMAREGNTLSAVVRLAWDNAPLQIMTKNTPATATGTHIGILGHITKRELLRHLSATEAGNGFANRFLWLWVERSKFLPECEAPDLSALQGRVRQAIQRTKIIGQVERDAAAKELWAQEYRVLSEGKPGLFGDVTARSEAQVLRLSVLYAVLDGSAVIRVPHLQAALAVWRYCEDSARYIFGDATGDPEANRILNALRVAPAGLSRTDIGNLFHQHQASSRVDQALALLSAAGLARCDRQQTGGRPLESWFAV